MKHVKSLYALLISFSLFTNIFVCATCFMDNDPSTYVHLAFAGLMYVTLADLLEVKS